MRKSAKSHRSEAGVLMPEMEENITVEASTCARLSAGKPFSREPIWTAPTPARPLFTGEVVGYAMGERMTKNLASQSLLRAVAAGQARLPAADERLSYEKRLAA